MSLLLTQAVPTDQDMTFGCSAETGSTAVAGPAVAANSNRTFSLPLTLLTRKIELQAGTKKKTTIPINFRKKNELQLNRLGTKFDKQICKYGGKSHEININTVSNELLQH